MNASPVPASLERDTANRSLVIGWSDGTRQEITYRTLRDHCPCAGCTGHGPPQPVEPNPLRVLSAAEAQPLEIVAMAPAGSYAYHIHFSDGHTTGIYTFELLRGLPGRD